MAMSRPDSRANVVPLESEVIEYAFMVSSFDAMRCAALWRLAGTYAVAFLTPKKRGHAIARALG
jgi:hypothetical protein